MVSITRWSWEHIITAFGDGFPNRELKAAFGFSRQSNI